MALKEKRRAALAKTKTATLSKPKPAPEPKQAEPDPVAVATLQTLHATLSHQAEMLGALSSLVETQGKQLQALVKRPIKVEAGDVEVNLPEAPPRPVSFTCEFDDGRTATLTPNYEALH